MIYKSYIRSFVDLRISRTYFIREKYPWGHTLDLSAAKMPK